MRITWKELVVKLEDAQAQGLLREWQWLVGDDKDVITVTSLGDAFLVARNGSVHWLDVGSAKLERVAESEEQFDAHCRDKDLVTKWFMPQLVGDIMSAGMNLAPGQVFSFKMLPTLGGKWEPDNFEPADADVHFTMHGSLQSQIRDLPDGTVIDRFE